MQLLFRLIVFNLLILICSGLIFMCSGETTFNYNLDTPDVQNVLPDILNEVSGLTDIDSSHVACVQDELGTIFIYNFISGKIVSQHLFDTYGDFEGLTYTGEAIFILRSDGRLTEWNDFKSDLANIKHYKLPLLTANNEGLCYDKKHNRILIAAKSTPLDHDKKSERFIYSFDISKKTLLEKPLYSLNTGQLAIKAQKFNIPTYSTTKKGKKKPFNFRPSSLAVHPLSDDIYIISATDKLLLVINRKGEVIQMKELESERFTKAEGITFLHDGTMIITNEAAGKVPTLLVYKTKKMNND